MRSKLPFVLIVAVLLLVASLPVATAAAAVKRGKGKGPTHATGATGQTGPVGAGSGASGGASAIGLTGPVGLTGPSGPTGATGAGGPMSGGAGLIGPVPTPSTPLDPTVPGFTGQIIDGIGFAPAQAPLVVQKAIWAGNQIRTKPYILGGGHGPWRSPGYDCSGAVSYVLHAAGLLKTPEDSGQLMDWGDRGPGVWITVWTNPGHAFVDIAGIRFDTSAENDPNPPPGTGPRWRPPYMDAAGFTARHPFGY